MLQFVREIPIRIVIQETPSAARRGFLFHVSAGFDKELDTASGMSVNLVLVDRWLDDLKSQLESQDFTAELEHVWRYELLQRARKFLTSNAEVEQTELVSLIFREERGSSFSWHNGLSSDRYHLKHAEYVELFTPDQKFDLVRIEFVWSCLAPQSSDLKKMGRKLIKLCSQKGAGHLIEALQSVVGLTLPDETSLHELDIHHLGEGYKLTLNQK